MSRNPAPRESRPADASGAGRRGHAAALAAACCAVIAIYAAIACTAVSELGSRSSGEDYYNRLADGLAKGHLSLDLAVPPGLAALPDPYDRDANRVYRGQFYTPGRLHDLSYYRGRLYLYFSVVPALLLFLPWHLVTGGYVSHQAACLTLCSLGFLASALLADAIRRRCFPRTSIPTALVATLCLGLVPLVPIVLQRPDVWEVPIAFSYALWMLSLLLLWGYLGNPPGSRGLLCCLGAAVGLAIGCRPNGVLGAAVLAIPLWREILSAPAGARARKGIAALAALGLPLLAVFAGLAAYNRGRFGDAFEFGQRYQLNEDVHGTATYFRARFLWYDLRMYFLEYPGWDRFFPYVRYPQSATHPQGHGGVAGAVGVLTLLPFTLLALAAPLGLRRGAATHRAEAARVAGAAALLFLCIGGPLCLFFGVVLRYQMEFVPFLVLLAAVGLFGIEARLSRPGAARTCALAGAYALAVLSIGFNLLMATAQRATTLGIRGDLAASRRQWDEAGDLYRRSLRLAPAQLHSMLSLGAVLIQEDRIGEARGELEKAVRVHPESADAHVSYGWTLFKSGRLGDAAAQCEEALAIRPGMTSAEMGLRQVRAAQESAR
jgi:tetratricopeptide (TPR) repeat protein